jgi:hypothetical protein
MAGTFGLFLLPRGCLRHFDPALEDPVAAEEAEGFMV